MSSGSVNELEIKTQDRLLHKVFEEKLKYTYLGNFEDRENNSNVEEELLLKFLIKKYPEELASKAIAELKKVAHNETKSLYEVNKEVYELLKYGKNNKKEQDKEKIKMNANDETFGTVRERERERAIL